MALTRLSFSKSWTDPADFPTVETDETVIRQDMQQLHDETKIYLNDTLLPAIEAGYAPVGRTVNGHALTADVAVTKEDVGLGQVDNTADMDKPVSTAQAAAIQAVAMGQIPAGSVGKTMLDSEVAAAVGRAEEGGGLDQKIADTAAGKAALLHAAQHGASGSDPVTPAAIGAVARAGDTMTGDLILVRSAYPSMKLKDSGAGSSGRFQHSNHTTMLETRDTDTDDNRRYLQIYDQTRQSGVKDALRLADVVNGTYRFYTLLHEGNLSDFAATQCKVVEYTGTETAAVSVAVGFVPRLAVVQEVTNDAPVTLPLVLTNTGVSLGLYRGSSGDLDGFEITVTAFGATVSWEGGNAAKANNSSGKTYRLTAIG